MDAKDFKNLFQEIYRLIDSKKSSKMSGASGELNNKLEKLKYQIKKLNNDK